MRLLLAGLAVRKLLAGFAVQALLAGFAVRKLLAGLAVRKAIDKMTQALSRCSRPLTGAQAIDLQCERPLTCSAKGPFQVLKAIEVLKAWKGH